MKCVKSPPNADGIAEIRRVHEYQAKLLVEQGWHYISKGEWKRHVRPDLTKAKAEAAVLVKTMQPMRRV